MKGIESLLAASSSRIDANAAPPMVASLEQAVAQCQANHHEGRLSAEDKPFPPVEAATGSVITSEDHNVSVYTCSLFPFMKSNPATDVGIFSYTWISEHQFPQRREDGSGAKAKAKARLLKRSTRRCQKY